MSEKLEEISFGILCLTRENQDEPWILFEAGALSKKGDSRVIPYLLGMAHDDIDYPLRQFNVTTVTHDGTLGLVRSLNAAVSEHALAPDTLVRLFEKLWPDFDAAIKKIPDSPVPPKQPPPVDAQLVDIKRQLELLTSVVSRQER